MVKYILLATALILSGCSTADTNGPITERLYRAPIDIDSGGGDVNLTVNLNASSDAETASTQSPRNTAETPTEIDLNLRDLNNPVSTMTEVLERKAETVPILKPDKNKVEVLDNDDASWQHSKTYEMHKLYDDGRPFYRLGIPGEQFGKTVLFKDDKGNEFLIPDTSVDTGDRAQQFFFTGKGETKTFDGNASLFWFKDGSEKVTAYYNGVEK